MSSTSTIHRVMSSGHHDVRNAWLSLLLLPVAFVAAFAGGGALMSLLGYAGDQRVPPTTAALVAIPIVLVVAVPAALSSWFATRGTRRGDARGWLPAALLIALAVVFGLQNVVAYLVSW